MKLIPHKYQYGRVRVVLSRVFDVTFVAVLFGVLLFYLCNWQYLRSITTDTVFFVLKTACYEVRRHGNVVFVNGQLFDIKVECTYIDWLLIAMPFVLSYSNCLWKSCISGFILTIIWFSVNIVRIWL